MALATWANPVDLDYRYSPEQRAHGISYRTGADPVVVRYRGAYYLFATLADGYWTSTDLASWRFVKADGWPAEQPVAPAVLATDSTLFMLPSAMAPTPLFASHDPASGRWSASPRVLPRVGPPTGPWDPALFRDDDGKTYLYWGSSNLFPLYGVQVDLAVPDLVGRTAPLINLDPPAHGWERFGRDHADAETRPFLEGAWMTKRGDRYYLQYGAPGTEHNVYATGVYVGSSPLGPFAYAPYNPVAYKPGGFVTGAGHGSTFEDAHGNLWSTGTAWVGLNWPFERRIDLFPAGFHDDGQLWVDTRFGDFPHRIPDRKLAPGESTFTGWMLLSYRREHPATDEDPRTYWLAEQRVPSPTLTVDLGAVKTVRAVQVDYADVKADTYANGPGVYTTFALEGMANGEWTRLATVERDRDRPNAYIELERPARVRWVRYRHGHTAGEHVAIAELRVFGNGDGPAPAAPKLVSAQLQHDARNAVIVWEPVAGVVGYNVRWGIAADRLYSTYQRWAHQQTRLELRALSKGGRYFVAVEAFDGNGVSPLSRTIPIAP
ncbi:MAG: family 43 glycosylhydrolase [Myxococcota bacterium]